MDATVEIMFCGAVGLLYSPPCIKVKSGTMVTFTGNTGLHPLAGGEVIVGKAPSADLVVGQTDEGDFGISYPKADELLNWMLSGYDERDLVSRGFDETEVALVKRRLSTTHWKRRLPTVAMLSGSAIGESYLRPVDY